MSKYGRDTKVYFNNILLPKVREKSFTYGGDAADITNDDSNGYRELCDRDAVRYIDIEFTGVMLGNNFLKDWKANSPTLAAPVRIERMGEEPYEFIGVLQTYKETAKTSEVVVYEARILSSGAFPAGNVTPPEFTVVWGVSAGELPTQWPHIADFGEQAGKRYAVQLYFTVSAEIDTGTISIYRNGFLLNTLPTLDYSSGSAASDTGYDTPQGYTEVLNDGGQLKIAFGYGVDAYNDGAGSYVIHVGSVVSEPYIINQAAAYNIEWGFTLLGLPQDPQFEPRVLENLNEGTLPEHRFVLFFVFCIDSLLNTNTVHIYKNNVPWHSFPALDLTNGEAQTGTYSIDRYYAANIGDPHVGKMSFAHEWALPTAADHNGTYKIVTDDGVESAPWTINEV